MRNAVGVTSPDFTGYKSGSEITKKLKIRLRIQGRNHNISSCQGWLQTRKKKEARQTTGRSASERASKRCFPRRAWSAQGRRSLRDLEIRVGDEHRSFRAECEKEGCRIMRKEKDVLTVVEGWNNSNGPNGRMERKRYDESGRTSKV